MIWQLRKSIDEIDNEIIRLLAKRLEVAKILGEVKSKMGLAIVDKDREGEVVDKWVAELTKAGFDELSARGLAKLVVKASTRAQSKGIFNIKVAIVGSGRLGRTLERALSHVAPTVLVKFGDSLPESDIVILAVKPTEDALSYIDRNADAVRGKVLLDAFSVKHRMFKAIEALSIKHGFRYISMHPLFGDIPDAWGESVILIPSSTSGNAMGMVINLLRTAGLDVLVINDPEVHDKLMAYIQVAHHTLLIALYLMIRDALRDLGIGMVTTHSLKLTMEAVERVIEQLDVVSEIQLQNPYSAQVRNMLCRYINMVNEAFLRGEIDKLMEMKSM